RLARAQAERDQRTVRELKDEWIAWLERRGRKLGTIYTYDRQLESNFLNEFGDRAPTNIEAREIDKWYTQLAEDTTQRNASGVYRTVASMFRYAAVTAKGLTDDFDRWIDESPCKVPGGAAKRRSKQRDKVLATREQTRQMDETK